MHNRGWVDTRGRVAETLKADEFLSKLVSRNLDSTLFHGLPTGILSACMTIFCNARYLAHGLPSRPSDYINALVIGELMAPQLPEPMSLATPAANKEFIFVMRYLKSNETLYTRGKTFVTFRAMLEAANAERAITPPVHVPAIVSESIGDMVTYLEWLASSLNQSLYMTPLKLLLTTYISVAKRGTISERFSEKITTGMRDDLGMDVELDLDTLHRTYVSFGRYVDESNAEAVFRDWLADIPEHALRLKLTLTQVTGSGLTAYIIIGRAVRKYMDFPWSKLNTLTGNEVDNFRSAVALVNGNAYYGFKKELGAVKSTNYSSVAYVAKELLIQINGELSLKQYQGWIKKLKNPLAVLTMIERYVTKKEQELNQLVISDGHADGNQELIDLVNQQEHADMFI